MSNVNDEHKNKIINFFYKKNVFSVEISNENINTIHNIIFNQYHASLDDHNEILYYYALYNHVTEMFEIAHKFYLKIIELKTASNYLIGCTLDNLGLLFYYGDGVIKNNNKAIEYFESAIKYNIGSASHHLADACVNIDAPKAIELYKKSAELGTYVSIKSLANLHKNGLLCTSENDEIECIIEKNIDKTIEIYEQAIENGFCEAYEDLAEIYQCPDHSKYNYGMAIELYKKAIASKNQIQVDSHKYLYSFCDDALDFLVDFYIIENENDDAAIELCKNEIEHNNQHALNRLACLYKNRYIKSKPNAIEVIYELYETAINMDNHEAMDILSDMKQLADDVTKNPQKALGLFHMALNKNNGDAAKCIGAIYQYGCGVPIDLNAAAKYYATHCNMKINVHMGEFIEFIDFKNNVDWTTLLHKHWPVFAKHKLILDNQITILLFISKNKNLCKSLGFFVKGICHMVIKFLMKNAITV